jgi:hypothetical protein
MSIDMRKIVVSEAIVVAIPGGLGALGMLIAYVPLHAHRKELIFKLGINHGRIKHH